MMLYSYKVKKLFNINIDTWCVDYCEFRAFAQPFSNFIWCFLGAWISTLCLYTVINVNSIKVIQIWSIFHWHCTLMFVSWNLKMLTAQIRNVQLSQFGFSPSNTLAILDFPTPEPPKRTIFGSTRPSSLPKIGKLGQYGNCTR